MYFRYFVKWSALPIGVAFETIMFVILRLLSNHLFTMIIEFSGNYLKLCRYVALVYICVYLVS